VAASIAYGFGVNGPSSSGYDTVLVFDLGGGTLDCSLLEGWDGILEVRMYIERLAF
jgi:molecular chaperone DnaK